MQQSTTSKNPQSYTRSFSQWNDPSPANHQQPKKENLINKLIPSRGAKISSSIHATSSRFNHFSIYALDRRWFSDPTNLCCLCFRLPLPAMLCGGKGENPLKWTTSTAMMCGDLVPIHMCVIFFFQVLLCLSVIKFCCPFYIFWA